MNDMVSPWPSLSLLPSKRLFLLHSKYVCPVLPVDRSEFSPPQPRACPRWSSLLSPSTHPSWAPGPDTQQVPAVLKGQLLMVPSGEPALFCPDSSAPHSCRTGDMSWLTGKGS